MTEDTDKPQLPTGKCKSCGAKVVWALTETGRPMPVDAYPSDKGSLVLSMSRASGAVKCTTYDQATHYGRNKYTSHFATCAQAQQWRKP